MPGPQSSGATRIPGCRHLCGRCPWSPRPPGAPGSSSQVRRKWPFQMVTAELPALSPAASERPPSETHQPRSLSRSPLKPRALMSWARVTWPRLAPGTRAPGGPRQVGAVPPKKSEPMARCKDSDGSWVSERRVTCRAAGLADRRQESHGLEKPRALWNPDVAGNAPGTLIPKRH